MTTAARATAASESRLLRAALAAASLGIVAVAWTGRIVGDPVPVLLGVAALCVVGLTRRTAPAIAWLATIAAAFGFAAPGIALSRAADPGVLTFGPWLAIAGPAGVGASLTLLVATWFANRPERPPGRIPSIVAWAMFGWLSIAIVVTWVAVAAGQRDDPSLTWIDVASAPVAWYVPFVALATAIGVLAEIRWASQRAFERRPPGTPRGGAAGAWALGLATLDELMPGRGAAVQATAAAERRQIAGDLHAAVVPSLRRAIAEAEAGADPVVVLRHLRAADLELERLMTDRWPIVLETFGLVPALEDFAERLETEGGPPIEIDVDRSEGRPPHEIERAAWRIAQIALDNAVRHSAATRIAVRVSIDQARVRLAIADDGRGFQSDGPGPDRGRGIPDAIRRGADVGGRVTVEPGPLGGTSVSFDWPDEAA